MTIKAIERRIVQAEILALLVLAAGITYVWWAV